MKIDSTLRSLTDSANAQRSSATEEMRSALAQMRNWSQGENEKVLAQVSSVLKKIFFSYSDSGRNPAYTAAPEITIIHYSQNKVIGD